MMPALRGREKLASEVFLITPLAVAITTYSSGSNSLIGNTAVMRSFSTSGNRFTSGRPRAVRPACGTS